MLSQKTVFYDHIEGSDVQHYDEAVSLSDCTEGAVGTSEEREFADKLTPRADFVVGRLGISWLSVRVECRCMETRFLNVRLRVDFLAEHPTNSNIKSLSNFLLILLDLRHLNRLLVK